MSNHRKVTSSRPNQNSKAVIKRRHSEGSKLGPTNLDVTKNHSLAQRISQPLQKAEADHNVLVQDKLPPDLLGNAAYLFMASKVTFSPQQLEAAILGALTLQEQMRPRDGLESLGINQVLALHARIAFLTKLLSEQTNLKSIDSLSAALDRAVLTLARLMQALDAYRRPRSSGTTVSIGQANVAGEQVVQNIQSGENTSEKWRSN